MADFIRFKSAHISTFSNHVQREAEQPQFEATFSTNELVVQLEQLRQLAMSKAPRIREFNEAIDVEEVDNLEKSCAIGSRKKVSIFFDMMGDPLCRIKFYPVHVMLVADMLENGELVGVVRGCIKEVGAGLGSHAKMGCILGLRVSPRHRRLGIGFNLIKAVEEWLARNGAEYVYLATEDDNVASINLFTLKCHYEKLSSLLIFIRQVDNTVKKHTQKINIKKLQANQAISLYGGLLKCKDLYPTDIEAILRAKPTLGTWVCYFNDEQWDNLHCMDHSSETIASRPSSWMVFSLWNSGEVYKLQIRRSCHLHYLLSAALSQAKEVIFPCMKLPLFHSSAQKSFGFLFIYGFHGEGERLSELSKAAWNFAAELGKDVSDCKLIMTEVGTSDPLFEHIPRESSTLRIKDIWYFRKVNNLCGEDEEATTIASSSSGPLGNVFIDPRDF